MKITFKFENGTSEICLIPENARDERYIELCVDGRTQVKVGASKDKMLKLLFSEQEKQPKTDYERNFEPIRKAQSV